MFLIGSLLITKMPFPFNSARCLGRISPEKDIQLVLINSFPLTALTSVRLPGDNYMLYGFFVLYLYIDVGGVVILFTYLWLKGG